jgi:dTDP-4-dehydrorhamnose 3,5-epimerase
MKFSELELSGAFLVEIDKIKDDRGFFGRAWCKNEFDAHGLKSDICQINTSLTHRKGTLRGMHYQVPPATESKFVRCTKGRIYDVIVDLRPESPTFMDWTGIELSSENFRMLYVPERFGHGFLTLEDGCEMYYIATQFYTPSAERGLRWDDPALGINWPESIKLVSERDKQHPAFNDLTAKELKV